MSIELIEKRQRRLIRQRRELADFRHALRYLKDPVEALKWTVGLFATWHAVRRVASTLIAWPVQDVPTAWAIVYYVRGLPDGNKRLKEAVVEVVARWESECEAKAAKAT